MMRFWISANRYRYKNTRSRTEAFNRKNRRTYMRDIPYKVAAHIITSTYAFYRNRNGVVMDDRASSVAYLSKKIHLPTGPKTSISYELSRIDGQFGINVADAGRFVCIKMSDSSRTKQLLSIWNGEGTQKVCYTFPLFRSGLVDGEMEIVKSEVGFERGNFYLNNKFSL